jgi:hypothetical protein
MATHIRKRWATQYTRKITRDLTPTWRAPAQQAVPRTNNRHSDVRDDRFNAKIGRQSKCGSEFRRSEVLFLRKSVWHVGPHHGDGLQIFARCVASRPNDFTDVLILIVIKRARNMTFHPISNVRCAGIIISTGHRCSVCSAAHRGTN